MKKLLLVLFLTGCSSFGEYRQGCYDTLDALLDNRMMPQEQVVQLENEKNMACNELVEKRSRRSQREMWNPPIYTPPYRHWDDED